MEDVEQLSLAERAAPGPGIRLFFMLMLKMIAQTGNNMFQYAACKTLAEDRGYRFSFRGGRQGKLHKYFELDGETALSLVASNLYYRVRTISGRNEFRPRRKYYDNGVYEECFDERFFEIKDGTTIRGFFQSPGYFNHNRNKVLKWFTPRGPYRQRLDELDRQIPAPPDQRCCIHLRRGDYHEMEKKNRGMGWLLPMAYYQEAIARLPEGLCYVIVSDDVEAAVCMFSELKNKFIVRGNPCVVDMLLFTRCKYNIIANSSFSWWGGWLNDIPGKTVFAPMYHLGWQAGVWLPDRIAVGGWQYIDVTAAQQERQQGA